MNQHAVKGAAVLFAEMTAPAEAEDAFNAWQDERCGPALVDALPGILSAMRYRSDAGPYYAWILELASAEALNNGAARVQMAACDAAGGEVAAAVTGQTRYLGVEAAGFAPSDEASAAIDAPIVHAEFHTVPFERTAAFEDWLERERAPMLLECPGWRMVRRCDLVDCDPEFHTHLILHYLADAAALDSDAARLADAADGAVSMAAESWFDPRAVTYRRRGARFIKSG